MAESNIQPRCLQFHNCLVNTTPSQQRRLLFVCTILVSSTLVLELDFDWTLLSRYSLPWIPFSRPSPVHETFIGVNGTETLSVLTYALNDNVFMRLDLSSTRMKCVEAPHNCNYRWYGTAGSEESYVGGHYLKPLPSDEGTQVHYTVTVPFEVSFKCSIIL